METPQEIATKLPHRAGVYLYKNADGAIIYIGKAKDLRRRVLQYFQREAVGEKTKILVSQIHSLDTIATDSEFDALLLEAKLIREHLPKYNVISRDDKSPLYIAITLNEPLPRIQWLRKTSLSAYPKATYFGPFQSGKTARMIVRDLRSIIPYCTQKNRTGKPCFYTHIGLCDPCPSVIARLPPSDERTLFTARYRSNIRKIAAILSGKSLTVVRNLEREMKKKAGEMLFEEAHAIKKQVDGIHALLERHFDPYVYTQNELFVRDIRAREEESLYQTLSVYYPNMRRIHRVECIDISNTQGTYSTGSMVVLVDGMPNTGDYRRFKMRTSDAPNDYAMISEVLRRRLKHVEWKYPELLVIDGGKGQVSAAIATLARMESHETPAISIPVIGLAKRFEEIIIPLPGGAWKTLKLPLSNPALHLLMRIRDESHRFALKYHRLLRNRAFLREKG